MEPLHGSCLCQGITYSIKGEPAGSVLCHCINCQKSSGSAFQANLFCKKTDFTLLSGAHLIREYADDAIDAPGTVLSRSFCSVCGSNIYTTNATNPAIQDTIIVMSGCLDEASKERTLPPQNEFYCKRRRDWVRVSGIETTELQGMT